MNRSARLPTIAAWLLAGAALPASAADPPAVTDLAGQLQQCAAVLWASARPGSSQNPGEQSPEWTSGGMYYPPLANLAGEQGTIALVMMVDAYGNPRYPHALAMTASGDQQQFLSAAIDDIRRNHFDPALEAGQPAAHWVMVRLAYEQPKGMYIKIHFWNDDYLAGIRKAAEGGNVTGMAAASYVDFLGAPLLHEHPRDDDVRWRYLAYAALGGDPVSLLRANGVLTRAKCSRSAEFNAAFNAQAEKGNPWIALALASRLLQVDPKGNGPRALAMLRIAARSPVASARALAIGILATWPDESLRDPGFALAQASSIKERADADTLEAYAAALAANRNFTAAVEAEESALDIAKRGNWHTDRLQHRLQRYRDGLPADGPVCDCTEFAP